MTGDEIKAARISCRMSREELGTMLGVSAQVVGAWERIGSKHLATGLPGESEATRRAKEKLPAAVHFMTTASVLCLPASSMVMAPHDWMPLLSQGDPLLLTDEPAVEGDLVLLRDANGELSRIARVQTWRDNGQLLCFVRPYEEMPLPGPDGYKTIEYSISRQHDGIPDKLPWTVQVPPDLV